VIWLLVLLFFTLIFLGIPVSFSMAIVSLLGLWVFDLPLMMMIQKMHSGNDQFPFLAVPFFILAGMLMETGGISLRLVNLARGMVGHLRGGLGMVAVVSEVFFSGISGSSLADASAIGSMMLPALRNGGYSKEHSVCIISAATGMGILIPPCLNMLVLAAIANLSVAALFLAGFLPGFFMAIVLMLFIYYQSRRGILPSSEGAFNLRRLGTAAVHSALPMMMPVIIFGGILGGVATATEAAVLAVAYALIVGLLVYREIRISDLPRIFVDTLVITGSMGLLVGASTLFSWILATQQVPEMVGNLMMSFTKNPYVFLVVANLFFIVTTGLMDGLPALLIFYPILYPIALKFGIHPIHFTLLAVAASGIGLILPPIGLVFIIMCSISKTPASSLFWPMFPYVLILVATFFVILFIPWFVLLVPRLAIPGFT
jgi:tripartite ATP-independent transporter DctM subunit